MFRLTREVRFAVNAAGDDPPAADDSPAGRNGHAGYPPLTGLGHYFTLALTLQGELDPTSNYLLNIKHVDQRARELAIPVIERAVVGRSFGGGAAVAGELFATLRDGWPAGVSLTALRLWLSPFLSLSVRLPEYPMTRLSQRFEFSASHRLLCASLDDAANREIFGKCSNPHGHGHNYELEVTLVGTPNDRGLLIDVPAFERAVAESVIARLDHRNLNVEVPEFRELNPTVENIARVIYRMLKPRFEGKAALASVTVWETPKTWCEYSE